jgi:hypothetical protein
MFVNIKSIWQPNMVYPESICPYTSSQLGWELPEQQEMLLRPPQPQKQ